LVFSLFNSRAIPQPDNMTNQPINLLWTGGWDSTFRFLQIVLDYKHPNHPAGHVYQIKRSLSDEHPKSIYKYFRFPLLDFTKIDMLEHSKRRGYFDILNLSWFCFTPINGKPCGLCNPCKTAVHEGMDHRLPSESLLRNKYHKAFETAALIKKTAKRQVRKVFPEYN